MGIPNLASPHPVAEPQFPPTGNAAQQPPAIIFPKSPSDLSHISLKERAAPLATSPLPPSWLSPTFFGSPENNLSFAPDEFGLGRQMREGEPVSIHSVEGSNMLEENLLMEAQQNGITFADGIAHIAAGHGFEQWECLKKTHHSRPITHLICEQSENLDSLLVFLQLNKGLTSLDLGKSPNITDGELEKILPYLPALESFSIDSANLTRLPTPISRQVKNLSCTSCPMLTTLQVLVATKVVCNGCTALIALSAPAATEVECINCKSITVLNLPAAATIRCWGCSALTTLEAPAALKIDCAGYNYSRGHVPVGCGALTALEAPLATTINCWNCTALVALYAPVATTIDCSHCTALSILHGPTAIRINCSNCTVLDTLHAPAARAITCWNCITLSALYAPSLTKIDGLPFTALARKNRMEIFCCANRNIIMEGYTEANQDFDKLLREVEGFPPRGLNKWLSSATSFALEADSTSQARVDVFLQELISLVKAEGIVKEERLKWFNTLKELDSPQKQMKRVIWFGALLMCCVTGKNPFAHSDASPTLMAIGNLANPFLQKELTRVLLSMYDEEMLEQVRGWGERNAGLEPHQILPLLLYSKAKIGKKLLEELLKTLKPNYYKNTAVLTPILEMTCQLSFLSSVQQQKLLRLVFKAAPQKEKGEKKGQFNARLSERRRAQTKLVAACRDLLFFEKADVLIDVETEDDLLEKHKMTCREIFGIKEEFAHRFSDSFKSRRYFNALPAYAARLQTLSKTEKALLTDLLGKFVNGHLEGSFPANRYNLCINPHLSIIFKNNRALLEKWISPMEVDLRQSESVQESSSGDAYDMIKRLMADAINDNHLGDHQDALYPSLIEVLTAKNFEAIPSFLMKLEKNLLHLKISGDVTINKRNCVDIEMDCLKVLDPNATPAARVGILSSLCEKIPNSLEFKNDVKGILKALRSKAESWQKIESTDYWEDFLLMGTEVSNSCLRIDGDPKFNKCLLAYILDGKNKVIIVRDAEGKIAARSVLRILWSQRQQSPVLFMERVYTNSGEPALQGLIRMGCELKAKQMRLPLVACPQEFPGALPYKGVLSALGGPAPFEYVDALHGIQENGQFEIPFSVVLYMPKTELIAVD